MAKIIKKKFFEVDLPLIGDKYESYLGEINELNNKSIKVDITRKLRGKSVDIHFVVKVENNKAVGFPKKLILMPSFIKHMLHTGIDYVEDSITCESQESQVTIKPFLITRKKVSRAVRRTLRNSAKNWLVDYIKTKTDNEIFEEILSNQLQKPLSLKLKKVYPLAICEIRMFEVGKSLGKTIESKPIIEVEIKKEAIESEDGKIKEVKEEITENIEATEAKPEKKVKKSKKSKEEKE